ncbi:MAG: SPOR domain-containing protein [Pseudomonadales bacterium]|nr:SPOR domain-containing protein [Pseudomonadales bacterium]
MSENSASLPAWAWLLTGVVTGLFLAFLYYLAGVKVPSDGNTAVTNDTINSDKGGSDKAPKFDFYTVLKDVEAMSESKPPKPNSAENGASPSLTEVAVKQVIQTGSFQNIQDADRRRAQLLLLGLEVKTEKVEVRPGQIFHRVQVGPFSNSMALKKAKQTLDENDIEHIVLTLKQ